MKLEDRIEVAKSELGRSVVRINPFLHQDAKSKAQDVLCFGVKNTNKIPMDVFDKLRFSQNYLWLTIDKMSDKGRSIDTDLVNPLTYRLMTGSTSGGPINILKGINDFALGTDGGGSVLGPAMSCQLPSIIGAGLNLFAKGESISTDNIKIRASIGIIAKNLSVAIKVMAELTGFDLTFKANGSKGEVKVAVPKRETVATPDRQDMFDKLAPYLEALKTYNYQFIEVDFSEIDKREVAIRKIYEVFDQNIADFILTYEGPVDVFGYGETIPQKFGKTGALLTKNSGKYLLRAANICKTTAITIPTDDIASGFLIVAKSGVENAVKAIELAVKLESLIQLPEVWVRYFLTEERHCKGFEIK